MFPPGRFPPIAGLSMLPGNVVGRSLPMLGRFITPGSVVGRFTLPSEGRSPPPGSDGRFCPIPIEGRVAGTCMLGGLIAGRLGEFGNEGRVAREGFEGSDVGRETFGSPPTPPNDGREPPNDGRPPEFPPIFGIDGRALTFPNDGPDWLGREMLGTLGLDTLGILGRDMFGRAPPPPMLPIDGLAPPPPMDGLPPPPPPLPRCAKAVDDHTVPKANATITAVAARMFTVVNMELFLIVWLDYLPAAGGILTTVI